MDTLSSAGLSEEQVRTMVSLQERRWPSLVSDNVRIREWADSHPDVITSLGLDVGAALMSDCRTDRLNCGRCEFWRKISYLL